jgi:hypothetical protein
MSNIAITVIIILSILFSFGVVILILFILDEFN